LIGNAVQINNLPPNIETVNDFIYLRSLITNTGEREEAMVNLEKIWTDRGITKKTK